MTNDGEKKKATAVIRISARPTDIGRIGGTAGAAALVAEKRLVSRPVRALPG